MIWPSSTSTVKAFNRSAITSLLVVQVTLLLRDLLAAEGFLGYWFQMSIPFSLGICAICIGLMMKVVKLELRNSRVESIFELLSAIVLVATICFSIYVRRPLDGFGDELWNGFGPLVLFLAVLTTTAVFFLKNTPGKNMLRGLLVALLLLELPTFLQPPGGIININDTTYHVLDEFLAQYNGFFPHSTYLPTYTAMFGWLIWPVRFINPSPQLVMFLVIAFANVFMLGIPLLIASTVKSLDSRGSFLLVLVATCTFMVLSGDTNGASTVLSGFSTFGRFLLPLCGLFLFSKSASTSSECRRKTLFGLSGVVSSITFFNNADFGFSYVIAGFIGLSTVAIFYKSMRGKFLCYLLGFVAFTSMYLIILYVFAEGFSLQMYITLVLIGQSGDIYFFKMDHLGPHLIIFMVTSGLLTLAVMSLRSSQRELIGSRTLALAVTSIISSLWTLALLLMFSVRPIIPFGAQQLLIPTALNLFLIFIYLGRNEFLNEIDLIKRRNFLVLPLLLIFVLPFASSLQLPNPFDEIKRVSGHARHTDWSTSNLRPPADGWTDAILSAQGTLHHPEQWLNAIKNYANEHAGEIQNTAYFGYMGNTVELLTGIKNVTAISGPEHMRFGRKFEDWACSPILQRKPIKVIAYGNPYPCGSLTLLGNDASGLLQIYSVNP